MLNNRTRVTKEKQQELLSALNYYSLNNEQQVQQLYQSQCNTGTTLHFCILRCFCYFVPPLHHTSVHSWPAHDSGNPPVLPHLLIARLTDGVGVKLWKKQRKGIVFPIRNNNPRVSRSKQPLWVSTFEEGACLQTLNWLFFILFWSWNTYLSSLLLWKQKTEVS